MSSTGVASRIVRTGLLVLIPFVIGVAVPVLFIKWQPDTALAWLRVKPVTVTVAHQQEISSLPPETQLDMSFGTLVNSLPSEEGYALDHYSLSYLINANQQMIGLFRAVKEGEANDAIRAAAANQLMQTDRNVSELLLLQKRLGHLHH